MHVTVVENSGTAVERNSLLQICLTRPDFRYKNQYTRAKGARGLVQEVCFTSMVAECGTTRCTVSQSNWFWELQLLTKFTTTHADQHSICASYGSQATERQGVARNVVRVNSCSEASGAACTHLHSPEACWTSSDARISMSAA
jgi:hypothetical protein